MATLAEDAPAGDDWAHELKFDGYRVFLGITNKGVTVTTARGQKNWTDRFSTIADAARMCFTTPALIDGEVVALRSDGVSDFQALQNSLSGMEKHPIVFYAFDLLYVDGFDLRKARLEDRRNALRELLAPASCDKDSVIRFSDDMRGRGEDVFRRSCEMGAEGIIAKRLDSPYQGVRTRDWLKIKCTQRQEFVVCGYTAPQGSRTHFGALLLGLHDEDGKLVYAGKVGTGFDEGTRKRLIKLMGVARRAKPPVAGVPRTVGTVTWVNPQIVVEVKFAEWTDEELLRHASFLGVREDRAARDVDREDSAKVKPKSRARKSARPQAVEIEGVQITSRDRLVFTDPEVTKEALVTYYQLVARWIMPHLANRPLALLRCPEGAGAKCFFQKHKPQGMGELVKTHEVKKDAEPYLMVDSVAGLITLAQFGAVELHGWQGKLPRLDTPDQVVFDLDPGDGTPWDLVVNAANAIKAALTSVGLKSFLKTSGKGLHVVAPLKPRASWSEVKDFAHSVALHVERQDPRSFIASMAKAKRKGKVFIDYLRNGRGATCVLPFSVRARKGAPVSFPIPWRTLKAGKPAPTFSLQDVVKLLSSKYRDPWKDFDAARRVLGMRMQKAFRGK